MNRIDGIAIVMASAYGSPAPSLGGEVWKDLVQLCGEFLDTPILISGDYNVRLAVEDRLNGAEGRDLGSAQLQEVLAQLGLVEMGPLDRRFTWRDSTSQSRLD